MASASAPLTALGKQLLGVRLGDHGHTFKDCCHDVELRSRTDNNRNAALMKGLGDGCGFLAVSQFVVEDGQVDGAIR